MSDEGERGVFEELEKPDWEYRTVGGIATATGLSESDVVSTLQGKGVQRPFWPVSRNGICLSAMGLSKEPAGRGERC